MSGSGQPVCVNSLRLSIYYGFQVFQYREVYLPQNTMKAAIVGNKLTESGNKVFTFCDFTHLWTVVSGLGFDLNSLGNWGSLGARVTGSLFQDMWVATKKIEQGTASNNFYQVGSALGDIASMLLDAKL